MLVDGQWGPKRMQNEQIVKELSNLRMKHEARRERELANCLFSLGVIGWAEPKATSPQRRRAASTNSLFSLSQEKQSFLCGRRSEASKEMELPWRVSERVGRSQ